MKKSLLSSCIALAIVGLPAGAAFAQTASQPAAAVAPAAAPVAASRLDAIMAKGTLRVGTTGDYRPFSYLNPESKQYEGLDIEMAQSLAQALGVKLELVPTTWANLMKDFEADKFDAAMSGVSVTLDRAKKGYFTIPLMREGKTPIARCTDKGKFETLADIDKPEVRVIVNAGGTNEKFARANLKKANIEVWKDNVTIFKQIDLPRYPALMISCMSISPIRSLIRPLILRNERGNIRRSIRTKTEQKKSICLM